MQSSRLNMAIAGTLYLVVGWCVVYARLMGGPTPLGKVGDAIATTLYAAGWWVLVGAARGPKPWQAVVVPIIFIPTLVLVSYSVLVGLFFLS
jgi:hypothetical protein